MKLGVEQEGLANEVRVVHLADFLLEAMKHEEDNHQSVFIKS